MNKEKKDYCTSLAYFFSRQYPLPPPSYTEVCTYAPFDSFLRRKRIEHNIKTKCEQWKEKKDVVKESIKLIEVLVDNKL